MVRQALPALSRMLAAVVLGLGSTLTCAASGGEHGGHGGGGGHTLGGYGGYGGYRGGFGYRGFHGYPGWYGFGLGLGLGYGLGYGFGYPYYPYYGGMYPAYPVPAYGPPVAPPPVCQATGQGPAPGGPVQLTDSDMLLSIRVPPDAVVRINDELTTQGGPRREFMSSGLAPGRSYTFVVTARWTEPNGQTVQREQRLHVQGGERRNVDFLTPPPPHDLPPVGRAGG